MAAVDKRIVRVSQAFVLASGAPIGWMIVQYMMGVDVYKNTQDASLVYWYMFLGSAVTFVSFGFYVGGNEMHLESLAITDDVTDLYNERFLQQRLPEELARVTRQRQHLSLLYISLDHFSDINNLYGSKVAADALKQIATAMRSVARKDEIIARVGASQFCIILTDCTESQAMAAAQRFLTCIGQVGFFVEKQRSISVTASIGLVSSETMPGEDRDLYSLAEAAMYRAKREGRNQIAIHTID